MFVRLYVHTSVHLYVRTFVRLYVYLLVYRSIGPFVRLYVYLSVHLSIYLSVRLSVYPSFCHSVCPSVCILVSRSVGLFVGRSVLPFVRPPVRISVCTMEEMEEGDGGGIGRKPLSPPLTPGLLSPCSLCSYATQRKKSFTSLGVYMYIL